MESLLKKHFGIYQYYLSVNKNKLMGYSINWGGIYFKDSLLAIKQFPLRISQFTQREFLYSS